VADVVPDLGIRPHLRAPLGESPGFRSFDEEAPDAPAAMLSQDKPAFNVADGLRLAAFCPVSDGCFDEAYGLRARLRCEQNDVAVRIAEKPSLVLPESLPCVIRPEEDPQLEPYFVLIRTNGTNLHGKLTTV
jgi:hypothetical protein